MLFQTQATFIRKISRGIRAIILLAANPPVIIADNLEHYRQALSKKPNISLAVLTNLCMLQSNPLILFSEKLCRDVANDGAWLVLITS